MDLVAKPNPVITGKFKEPSKLSKELGSLPKTTEVGQIIWCTGNNGTKSSYPALIEKIKRDPDEDIKSVVVVPIARADSRKVLSGNLYMSDEHETSLIIEDVAELETAKLSSLSRRGTGENCEEIVIGIPLILHLKRKQPIENKPGAFSETPFNGKLLSRRVVDHVSGKAKTVFDPRTFSVGGQGRHGCCSSVYSR